MDKKDFKVGQKVFLKIIKGSSAARYINKSDPEAWIKEKVVTKIGRKYITVADDLERQHGEEKFNLDDFSHCYTVGGRDYELFLSREEIFIDIKCEKLYRLIKKCFSGYENEGKYSIEQLRQIVKILEMNV